MLKSILTIILFAGSCSGVNCDQLPKSYTSYNEAIKIIKTAHFKIEEKVNTDKSSWIRGASYYSCDGVTGFFIFKTAKQEYIHSGVPLTLWNEFKNAESFGRYYDYNIKSKFLFKLNH